MEGLGSPQGIWGIASAPKDSFAPVLLRLIHKNKMGFPCEKRWQAFRCKSSAQAGAQFRVSKDGPGGQYIV